MNAINPVLPQAASRTDGESTTNSPLPSSAGLNNMFLKLLVAQLQHQSPLDPMDPTQFVGQLAQFSELSEVTQIEQMLQKVLLTGTSNATHISTSSAPDAAKTPIPAPMISSAVAAAQAANPVANPPSSILNSKIQGVF